MNLANTLEQCIHKAINIEVEKIVAEESELAAERVKKRVKERTAELAVHVMRQMDLQRYQDRLVITIYDDTKK